MKMYRPSEIKEIVLSKDWESLSQANLREADLYGADLREADLRGANLREANLYGASLRGADLREADLRGADLREADLRGADLREADLYGADLRYCCLCNTVGNGIELISGQTTAYSYCYTSEILWIGCKGYPIADWWKFDDDKISSMDMHALSWWKENKKRMRYIIKAWPAKPINLSNQ